MRAIHLLPLLAACKGPATDTGGLLVDAETSTVTLVLRNPSSRADPFDGISNLRLDITVDDTPVFSEDLDYPLPEGSRFPALTEYGIVRFVVYGIDGGQVLSLGRSAPIAVPPGEDIRVDVVFLPVNEAFPIDSEMHVQRSEHLARRLPDGRVLLLGGLNGDRSAALADIEIFDPTRSTFDVPGAALPQGVANVASDFLSDGSLMTIGGEDPASGTEGTTRVYLFDPITDKLTDLVRLGMPRTDHCAAHYVPNGFWVLGGGGSTDGEWTYGDLLRRDDDSTAWNSEAVALRGWSSTDVTGCLADTDGRVFVLGSDAASTGVADPTSAAGAATAFTAIGTSPGDPIFAWHPIIHRMKAGTFWVAGGIDVESGSFEATTEGRVFYMDSRTFVDGMPLSRARQHASVDPWILDSHLVVGCGFSAAQENTTTSVNSVEILNPNTEESYLLVELDRPRPGCQVTTLLDGSLLVTGGYDRGTDAAVPSAALIVPYQAQ